MIEGRAKAKAAVTSQHKAACASAAMKEVVALLVAKFLADQFVTSLLQGVEPLGVGSFDGHDLLRGEAFGFYHLISNRVSVEAQV